MRRSISLFQAVVGVTLFATIAMPIAPGGPSLLDLLLRAARESVLGAAMMLVMIASPQLFGLTVAIGGLVREDRAVLAALTWVVAVLQGMIVLVGINVIGSRATAPLALFGFAAVTGLCMVYTVGEAAASDRGLGVRWYVRWGALLIAGFGLWLRLQALAGLPIGPAIDVATAAAVLLVVSLARPQAQPAS